MSDFLFVSQIALEIIAIIACLVTIILIFRELFEDNNDLPEFADA